MILTQEETRQLQLASVEMLKETIKICDELGLRYYVMGGTMLGAVRHGGFIPWDDDIDIGLLRDDYELFLQKAPAMLPQHYFLQNYKSDPGYLLNISKIRDTRTTFVEKCMRKHKVCHGIFLDVFPLDYYPATKCEELLYKLKRKVYSVRIGMEFLWDQKKNPIKELLKQPLKLIWPSAIRAVDKREKLYKSFPPGALIANYCGNWGEKEIVPAEWYAEGCELTFEGITVCAPKEYDKWLTQVYGDYMKLPPKEKQITHHETEVIDIDCSYHDYLVNDSGDWCKSGMSQ